MDLALLRPRLSAAVALTAFAGALLHPGPAASTAALAAAGGVLLLAAAASAFNQVLERRRDASMARTRTRPVASGRLSPGAAGAAAGLLAAVGFAMLAGHGAQPAALGAGALLCYLGVYTPLKGRTSFAVLPGALCGALPLFIGWAAAGGALADHRIVLPAGLLFLWQVPHTWLIGRRHREDLERTGQPTPASTLGEHRAACLTALWLAAVVAATLLLPALEIVDRPAGIALALAAVLPAGAVAASLARSGRADSRHLGIRTNLAMVLILAALVAQGCP